MNTPAVTAYMRITRALRKRGLLFYDVDGRSQALCPSCKRSNLNIIQSDGAAVIRCACGGCTDYQVMTALGMDCRHLYDRPGRVTYTYTDEDGNPTRYVHRIVAADGSKTFRQSYPQAAG